MNNFTEFSLRFNRRGKLDQNEEASIEVRMYLNGKHTYYKTGMKITPKGWNEKIKKPKDQKTHLSKEIVSHSLKTLKNLSQI